MTDNDFARFWTDIHSTFGIDSGTKIKLAAYNRTFEKVEHVPAEALKLIQSRIEDLDTLPRNLSKAILNGWYEWKSRNPDRLRAEQESGAKGGCPNCHDGYIWAKGIPFGSKLVTPNPYVFRCGHCGGGEGAIPKATREGLEAAGYIITNPAYVKEAA
ncbi:hypothetical protein [Maridesulfovibrio ferrireducens]|uniref:hypothetical protein n=1 Tax=Maridesulfovibrio ferrireducens TaxID=246191 RepID=UPI001A248FC9|nr:hypothetical protein [Maridesulfovibrio ferrireducens]MBI9113254.1 hypothetical protein [Maridesulfovibrio ferrireducens]